MWSDWGVIKSGSEGSDVKTVSDLSLITGCKIIRYSQESMQFQLNGIFCKQTEKERVKEKTVDGG